MKDRDPKGQYMKIRLSSTSKSVIKISVKRKICTRELLCLCKNRTKEPCDKSTQELKKCKEDPRR